ncbi:MAG: MoaD/ThiS family protein [Chloroflexota bacterium]|nr:MAG: MoaD/ThiS family protein [Chloroflexota bacterium]
MATTVDASTLELHDLMPEPGEEWQRMLGFVSLGDDDKRAMAASAEPLLRRAYELVVGTYDYLGSVPETAAILGWEDGVDEAHLEERRRFFSVWLTRTLGMDTGDEFASYLYRAGKLHAGHGPRQIHTPPAYVTASIGLVLASFARFMAEAKLEASVIAGAMAGWNKYLLVQLHLMLTGYQAAMELEQGDLTVKISLFARVRTMLGTSEAYVYVNEGDTMGQMLRKFFNYFPPIRNDALERVWQSEDERESLWIEVVPAYRLKRGWRVLLNGRNVEYGGGLDQQMGAGDQVSIFPPGR